MTCYCDGTAHPWRSDYCGRFPAHDPDTPIERARRKARQERSRKRDIMTDRPTHVCQPCWEGDHSNHKPGLGGICIGCSCEEGEWM